MSALTDTVERTVKLLLSDERFVRFQQALKWLDTNHDGKLSYKEIESFDAKKHPLFQEMRKVESACISEQEEKMWSVAGVQRFQDQQLLTAYSFKAHRYCDSQRDSQHLAAHPNYTLRELGDVENLMSTVRANQELAVQKIAASIKKAPDFLINWHARNANKEMPELNQFLQSKHLPQLDDNYPDALLQAAKNLNSKKERSR